MSIPLFSEGRRRYYHAIGGTIALLGLLPLVGVPRIQLLGADGNWALALLGAGITVGGLFDHRFLRRLLRDVREVTIETTRR